MGFSHGHLHVDNIIADIIPKISDIVVWGNAARKFGRENFNAELRLREPEWIKHAGQQFPEAAKHRI